MIRNRQLLIKILSTNIRKVIKDWNLLLDRNQRVVLVKLNPKKNKTKRIIFSIISIIFIVLIKSVQLMKKSNWILLKREASTSN